MTTEGPHADLIQTLTSPPIIPSGEYGWRAIDLLPVGHMIVAEDGTILRANPTAHSIFNYHFQHELSGKKVEELIPERQRAEHVEHRRRFFDAPRQRILMAPGVRLLGLRKNGTEIRLRIGLNYTRMGDENVALLTISEVYE